MKILGPSDMKTHPGYFASSHGLPKNIRRGAFFEYAYFCLLNAVAEDICNEHPSVDKMCWLHSIQEEAIAGFLKTEDYFDKKKKENK